MKDTEFWQGFSLAGMPYPKARDFLENLGPNVDRINALRTWTRLSADERSRMERMDQNRLKRATEAGVRALDQSELPEKILEVSQPPFCLFTWGDTTCLQNPTIAIVGTRKASTYGRAVSRKFAEAFARSGVTVVSGGALGIDGEAHLGAIEANGVTAAVLGHGVDKVYPASHAGLFKAIKDNGCLISQFPIGTPSLAHNFPQRNQIIAALSDAVLVIEAPLKSGALTTVNAAAELGRPVFVVPGNISNPGFAGSHLLIREGATFVDHPDQILDAIGVVPIAPEQAISSMSEIQKRIMKATEGEQRSMEEIIDLTGLDPSELLAELTMLEMDGLLIKDGARYGWKP